MINEVKNENSMLASIMGSNYEVVESFVIETILHKNDSDIDTVLQSVGEEIISKLFDNIFTEHPNQILACLSSLAYETREHIYPFISPKLIYKFGSTNYKGLLSILSDRKIGLYYPKMYAYILKTMTKVRDTEKINIESECYAMRKPLEKHKDYNKMIEIDRGMGSILKEYTNKIVEMGADTTTEELLLMLEEAQSMGNPEMENEIKEAIATKNLMAEMIAAMSENDYVPRLADELLSDKYTESEVCAIIAQLSDEQLSGLLNNLSSHKLGQKGMKMYKLIEKVRIAKHERQLKRAVMSLLYENLLKYKDQLQKKGKDTKFVDVISDEKANSMVKKQSVADIKKILETGRDKNGASYGAAAKQALCREITKSTEMKDYKGTNGYETSNVGMANNVVTIERKIWDEKKLSPEQHAKPQEQSQESQQQGPTQQEIQQEQQIQREQQEQKAHAETVQHESKSTSTNKEEAKAEQTPQEDNSKAEAELAHAVNEIFSSVRSTMYYRANITMSYEETKSQVLKMGYDKSTIKTASVAAISDSISSHAQKRLALTT